MRERNAGNHADKTSPRCSMGCRGWGESGGTYPLLFLRLTFVTRRRLILLAGFFIPFLTLWWTLSRLTLAPDFCTENPQRFQCPTFGAKFLNSETGVALRAQLQSCTVPPQRRHFVAQSHTPNYSSHAVGRLVPSRRHAWHYLHRDRNAENPQACAWGVQSGGDEV
jgi:hypothetical protein